METGFQLSTDLLVAAPSPPLAEKRRKKLSSMLSDLDAVKEAHVAQVVRISAPGTGQPVLFIVVDDNQGIAAVRSVVQKRLKKILRFREKLDTRYITVEHELIDNIREAGTVIGWRD